ncbi:MAG: DUF1667 domain-containing protein [Candidatus Marinimicrobia bacterium]|nr:DUF1667 domain-containing protein [Candidatus Neomarinimicrobiota bacterium]
MNRSWWPFPIWNNMDTPGKKSMVCVVCPLGCKLSIERTSGGYRVEGSKCKRGKEYAVREFTNPTRMLTSTVKIRDRFTGGFRFTVRNRCRRGRSLKPWNISMPAPRIRR